MPANAHPQGAIIYYPYLWASQERLGETEGRKPRPTCLLLRMHDAPAQIDHLILLAVTSQPPRPDQKALEVPDTERRRGGLTRYPRAWIVISEYNYDIVEESFYYQPAAPLLGTFGMTFLREVAGEFRAALTKAVRVDRTS